MAINKNNKRLQITVSEKQFNWLHQKAKENNLQISKFVCWLIDKNISRFFIQLSKPDQRIVNHLTNTCTQEEWDSMFEEEPINETKEDELPF